MSRGVIGVQAVGHVEGEHEGVRTSDGHQFLLVISGRGESTDDSVHGLRQEWRRCSDETPGADFLVVKEDRQRDLKIVSESGGEALVAESRESDVTTREIVKARGEKEVVRGS
jgi:hypothetical protein